MGFASFAILILLLSTSAIAKPLPSPKAKAHVPPRLKVGEVVLSSRCQADRSQCLCPKNSKPVSFLSGNRVKHLVCIDSCKPGQKLRIQATRQGGRQGVCEGKTKP